LLGRVRQIERDLEPTVAHVRAAQQLLGSGLGAERRDAAIGQVLVDRSRRKHPPRAQ